MSRLSVVLTNYNNAANVGRAIDAIVKQSRPPDELIIQDDCSTDNSVEIIMPYVEKYPYVKFVRNENKLDAIKAMQKASSLATGDYIYLAGADGYVLPGFFETAMAMFETFPQAGLCCGNPAVYIRETGEINETELLWSDSPAYVTGNQLSEIIAGQNIQGHTAILRRDAFIDAGGFIDDLKWQNDWFLNLVAAFRYGVIYLPQSVAIDNAPQEDSYYHEGLRDAQKQAAILSNILRFLLLDKYKDVLPLFIKGAVMYTFANDVVQVVMKNPEFWKPQILLLIGQPLFYWNNSLVELKRNRAEKGAINKANRLIINCEQLYIKGKKIEARSIAADLLRMFPSNDVVKRLYAVVNA